ncbi:unnamed protein product [Rhizophagus irregularis]|nr:unnamed protein product [Rhizophagus irregularis]
MSTFAYSLRSYSNLNPWVAQLDKRVENVLVNRGKAVGKNKRRTTRNDSIDGERPTISKAEKPTLAVLTHEIKIRNQVIYLDPPIEDARSKWYNQFHEWLAIVCSLPRLQSSSYDIDLQVRGTFSRETTYSNLLNHRFRVIHLRRLMK